MEVKYTRNMYILIMHFTIIYSQNYPKLMSVMNSKLVMRFITCLCMGRDRLDNSQKGLKM